MGIFSRFQDIVNANINTILDKAEDPEKMTRLMMREMEDTLVELKSSCSKTIALKSKTAKEKDDVETMSRRWEERAKLALEKERDDLAKEALLEKKTCQNQLDILNNDYNHYTKMEEECKANIVQLEERLETVTQKYRLLIQRGKHAQQKSQVNNVIRNSAGADAILRFDELERRIQRMEADADVSSFTQEKDDLESKFNRMEADSRIQEELEALKRRVKGAVSPKAAAKDESKKA